MSALQSCVNTCDLLFVNDQHTCFKYIFEYIHYFNIEWDFVDFLRILRYCAGLTKLCSPAPTHPVRSHAYMYLLHVCVQHSCRPAFHAIDLQDRRYLYWDKCSTPLFLMETWTWIYQNYLIIVKIAFLQKQTQGIL